MEAECVCVCVCPYAGMYNVTLHDLQSSYQYEI